MKKYKLIFFLIGLVGLAIMISQVNLKDIDWEGVFFERLPFILLAGLILWLIIFVLHTIVYRQTIGDSSQKMGWFTLFSITVTGFALNNVTPVGLIGGEPYRILELKPYCGIRRATSATFTFTIFYVMGHILLWITGCLLYLLTGCAGDWWATVFICVVLAVCTALIVFLYINRNKGLVLPVLRVCTHLPFVKGKVTAFMDKNKDLLEMIDQEIIAFQKQPKKFAIAISIEYLTRVLEGVEYFMILFFLGAPVHLADGIIVLTLASVIGVLIFVIPMQAGTREGGMALYLDWIGIASPTILMAGMIYRIRDLICNAIGILGILLKKKSRKGSPDNTDSSDHSVS